MEPCHNENYNKYTIVKQLSHFQYLRHDTTSHTDKDKDNKFAKFNFSL